MRKKRMKSIRALLIKVLAGKILDFKAPSGGKRSKQREAQDRKKHNEEVLERVKKGKYEEDEGLEFSQDTVWEKKSIDVVDIGILDIQNPEHDEDVDYEDEESEEEHGEEPARYASIQVYHLPLDQFGKADVGPSINLSGPDDGELDEAIERALADNFNYIVIYSDNVQSYKDKIRRKQDELDDLEA